ncbi:MAG: alkane 1-monooxygenase [Candidatus Marinimicrobia bacterium]|nr:alkane 1-monooxygenase [Candidatus Neomarinimicrobiota bacterium]
MKYLKYYITPVLSPIIIIGIMLGGHWMWLGFVELLVVMIIGDSILGEDTSQPEYKSPWMIELPLHLALPIIISILISFAWSTGGGAADFLGIGAILSQFINYDFIGARNSSIWSDYIGGIVSVGFIVAGYGTNVAHELTHRVKDKLAMFEGRWLLSVSCNADFAIEHVYGHHVTVGTDEDPATAKKGENVYSFAIRSAILGHFSAWRLEIKRLHKKGISIVSIQNRIFTGYLMSILWISLFYIAGGYFGVILFLAQAGIAKFILEIVNYMEHYGLSRKPGQSIKPEHSWNTNQIMSGIVLFSLTRHSAHHEKSMVKFWKLAPYKNAPQMPYGYLTTLFICLIPPLWYSVITPRLTDWEAKYLAKG